MHGKIIIFTIFNYPVVSEIIQNSVNIIGFRCFWTCSGQSQLLRMQINLITSFWITAKQMVSTRMIFHCKNATVILVITVNIWKFTITSILAVLTHLADFVFRNSGLSPQSWNRYFNGTYSVNKIKLIYHSKFSGTNSE